MPRAALTSRKVRRFFLLAAALFYGAGSAVERRGAWEILGPGGGGAFCHPSVSLADPQTVLVSGDMTGSYISRDGGNTWREFNLRGRTRAFVFDPGAPKIIYARSVAWWRSTDAGRTWGLLDPAPKDITALEMGNDQADEAIRTDYQVPTSLVSMAVDPADGQTLYAAMQEGKNVSFYTSRNGGGKWIKPFTLDDNVFGIYVDPDSARENRTIYVVGAHTVSVRENGKWRMRHLPSGVDHLDGASAGFRKAGGGLVIYGRTGSQVWVSLDAGRNWQSGALPGSGAELTAVATSLYHPEAAYLSFKNLQLPEGAFFGVLKTADLGKSWQAVWQEKSTSAANLHDAWMSERFGPERGGWPLGLGVSPADPEICFATDQGRVMRTTDGGRNWSAVYSTRAAGGGYVSTGLDAAVSYGVHADPFDARRIFVDYGDISLFRSEDGGQSWISSSQGVPERWLNTTYWVVFDPEVRGRAWGGMSGVHHLPRPEMWRHDSPESYQGGVCRSEDGGRTWKSSSDGMPETAVVHILLDPRSPKEARVLYAAGMGRGVFKSADGGRHWLAKNQGLHGEQPLAWRLAQDPKGILYLVIARRSAGDRSSEAGNGALYRSSDGAENWERLRLPRGVNGPTGLAIDPRDPQRLYLSAWPRPGRENGDGGGIYLSTDGGASWRKVFAKDQHIFDVTVDAREPATLYASGFESSAWRSLDRGETWQRIRGYNFKWGQRVIPDPADPKMIYVTTFGSSVWHGPAAGDPAAAEDIVTPPLTFNAGGQ